MNDDLALAILRLCKSGVHVTFAYRDTAGIGTGRPGTPDTYYVITTRQAGENYKRVEIPRSEVGRLLAAGAGNNSGELTAMLVELLSKVK